MGRKVSNFTEKFLACLKTWFIIMYYMQEVIFLCSQRYNFVLKNGNLYLGSNFEKLFSVFNIEYIKPGKSAIKN